jgi:signal transduction histidine kinase
VDLELGAHLDGFDEHTNITAYRIIQESLTNVARHAAADTVIVRVSHLHEKACLHIEIIDNGCGMDPRAMSDERMGVRGMRERATGLGGRFELHSALGEGVRIVVELPIHSDQGAL